MERKPHLSLFIFPPTSDFSCGSAVHKSMNPPNSFPASSSTRYLADGNPTATMTRSMSRKGLSTKNYPSSLAALSLGDTKGGIRSGNMSEIVGIESTTSKAGPRARSKNANHSTLLLLGKDKTEMMVKPSRVLNRVGKSKASSSTLGMGVRAGPPVVQPSANARLRASATIISQRSALQPNSSTRQHPPGSSSAADIPYTAASKTTAILGKRAFSPNNDDMGDYPSPAKRLQLDRQSRSTHESSRRGNDENGRAHFEFNTSAPMTPRAKARHIVQFGTRESAMDEDDSSEDDIDFLSPRKKTKSDFDLTSPGQRSVSPVKLGGLRQGGGKIRSPERPSSRLSVSPLKEPTLSSFSSHRSLLSTATMNRPPTSPNSTGLSRSSYVVPSASYRPIISDTDLSRLFPEPTPSSPVSAAPLLSKFNAVRSSMIPRRIGTSVAATSIPPLLPPLNSYQNDSTFIDADVTMSEVGNVSSSRGGMSEEGSKRLLNLKAMLSRLSLPKPSTTGAMPAGGSMPSMTVDHAVSSRSGMTSLNARRRQTMTGMFREEYSVPLAGGDDEPARPRLVSSTSRATLGRSLAQPSRRASTSFATAAPSESMTVDPRPLRRSSIIPTSSSTAAISALTSNDQIIEGRGVKPTHRFLRDVIAYLDVRTLEGHDAGMIFVDLLKDMSARVSPLAPPSLAFAFV